MRIPRLALAAAAVSLFGTTPVSAAVVQINVTVENLSPTNSVSVAPLHVGFHSGVFDAFDIGAIADAAIVSVAEGGSGAAWFPAFSAADPDATLGTVLPNPAGPLLPGFTGTATFVVDTSINPYFTFAAMVVPSNDFFIGNDAPTRYRLFDDAGNLLIGSIVQRARDIWDAGSEVFDPAAAAFVGDNDLRAAQNSVVAFNFAELAAFDGLLTAPGYLFASQLAADTEFYRISFTATPVPVPAALPLLGGALATLIGIRRRQR